MNVAVKNKTEYPDDSRMTTSLNITYPISILLSNFVFVVFTFSLRFNKIWMYLTIYGVTIAASQMPVIT